MHNRILCMETQDYTRPSILYPDNGVCPSVCVCVTEVMSLPVWGPISACIVSPTVTWAHFRVIASAFNEY